MAINILLVDDEYIELNGLSAIIQRENKLDSSVVTASDGFEALEKLEDFEADIVITDINMPEMTGLELIEKIQERNLCKRFIILTGHSDVDYVVKALRLRAIDYVLKPIDTEILLNLLVNQAKEIEKEKGNEYEQILLKLRQIVMYDEAFDDIFFSINEIKKHFPSTNIAVITYQFSGAMQLGMYENHIRLLFDRIFTKAYLIRDSYSSRITAIVNWDNDKNVEELNNALRDQFNLPGQQKSIDLLPNYGISYISKNLTQIKKLHTNALNLLQLYKFTNTKEEEKKQSDPVNIVKWMQFKFADNQKDLLADIKKFAQRMFFYHSDASGFMEDICSNLSVAVLGYLRENAMEPDSILGNQLRNIDNKFLRVDDLDDILSKVFECTNLFYNFMTDFHYKANRDHGAWIDQVFDYISKNYLKDISLEDVAEHVKLHPSYLSSAFKRETGVTFIGYLNNFRIDKAKEILKNRKDMTMTEVSGSVGYVNERQFYKIFRNSVGITPGQFRSDNDN